MLFREGMPQIRRYGDNRGDKVLHSRAKYRSSYQVLIIWLGGNENFVRKKTLVFNAVVYV